MTVSTLSVIEACPRRWALGTARYPELWSGRGYPPRVQLRALSGSVVHFALEMITRALVNAGCASLQDPAAIAIVRNLGGYTKVVNDSIALALEPLASSPRAQRVLEYVTRTLRAQVPELRTRTQIMLGRLRFPSTRGRELQAKGSNASAPLGSGAFSELTLRARQIGWKGKADLLVLSEDECAIFDFKTGAPDEHHQFQLRVYALLWSRDAELNPNRRRADRLVLVYGQGDVEVTPPSETELDQLERDLSSRTAAALGALSERPPPARADPQQCPYCDVRHMCSDYWTGDTQHLMATALGERPIGDATLAITGRHGPSSWDGVVVSSAVAKQGQRVLLRANNRSLSLAPWQIVRVLSAHLTATSEDLDSESILIFTLGAASEIYLVP
jgi:hypothetical protein